MLKVSLYKNVKTFVSDTTTQEIIREIKIGVEQDKVIALRQLLSDGKQEEYDKQKTSLLSFTPSATFKYRRKIEFLNEYNGNIILDVDDLREPLLQQAKMIAVNDPYTYACFVSPGGEGLKIIVKTNATPETHKKIFNALSKYYEEVLNAFIDESGKDIQRLCLYSFDPEAYLNEESKIFYT